MKLVLAILVALLFAAPAQAHFVDYSSLRGHIRDTNIEGYCGKPDAWVCSGINYFVIVGDSWDNDGSAREGDHSWEWKAEWEEHRWYLPTDDRRCRLYFREYHYEFAERYLGPNCWG